MSRTEWTRFQQQYASKVRHLSHSPASMISSDALQMLQLYCGCSPLLPNLLDMSWDEDLPSLPFITMFISHSLTSILIFVPPPASRILPPILTRLPIMAPNISSIVVQLDYQFSLELEEASSQLLMQCKPHHLHVYVVHAPLSAPALRHLIQLPSLEYVLLGGPLRFPDPLPDVVFPSL